MLNKLFILLLMPLICSSQIEGTLTYQNAIEIALKNNYDIQIAKNNVSINEAQNTYGNAGFLPRIDLNGSGNIASNNTRQEFSNGLIIDKNNVSSKNISAGVYLTWVLFDGLKMFATKEKLELLEKSGQLNLKIQLENTVQQVTLAYFQIVKQEQLIKGIEIAKLVSDERIKIAEKKLAIGSGSNVELLQAKLDLNAQKANLLSQKSALTELKSNLMVLLKSDPNTVYIVETNFTFGEVKSAEEIKNNIEKTNNILLSAKTEISISTQFVKEIRAQGMPKLALNTNYVFGRNENAAGFSLLNQNLGYNVGLNFSWNLFNGFNASNQIKVANLQMQTSQNRYELAKITLFASVNSNYFKWTNDKEMLILETENILLAEEALKISTERLKLGLGNYLETKESQKSYEEAITRLVNARYNLKTSETQLKKITGELLK